jgi:hypothetical protein
MHPFYVYLLLQEVDGDIYGPSANWRKVSLSEEAVIDQNLNSFVETFAGDAQKQTRFAVMQSGMVFFPYKIISNTAEETEENEKPKIYSLATLYVSVPQNPKNWPARNILLDKFRASPLEDDDLSLLAYLLKADEVHIHESVRLNFVRTHYVCDHIKFNILLTSNILIEGHH